MPKSSVQVLVDLLNAQAVVDDMTKRDKPESEMVSARAALSLARIAFTRVVKLDESKPIGEQFQVK